MISTTVKHHFWQSKAPAGYTWFPVAAAYAAVVVPLSLWSMHHPAGVPGLALPWGHATEMLFGFALALVAGYLGGNQTPVRVAVMLGLWLIARISYWGWPGSAAALLAQGVFALALLRQLLPRLAAAKRWRNRMLMPLLFILAVLSLFAAGHLLWASRQVPLAASLLFALLMVFMGGRVIAPAVAGEHQWRGYQLSARVQPRIEAALIVLLFLAAFAALLELPRWAGLPVLIAGVLVAFRLWRWRLGPLRGRADLMALALGYSWLALGLVATGVQLLGEQPWSSALHLIMTGALGTLSTAMMLRVVLPRRLKSLPGARDLAVLGGLLASATLCRVAAYQLPHADIWLWVAAVCWSLAYFYCACRLIVALRTGAPRKPTRRRT